MSALEVFTVGHSNRSELDLIELLRRHEINTVVDVRSTPYSEWSPQFNRKAIAATLKEHDIAYSYLGDELGVRSDDPSCYDEENRVVYARLAATEQFRRGLRRVVKGAQRRKLALLCSEQDPIDCHRSIMLAFALDRLGIGSSHILHSDDKLETQKDLEERLLELRGFGQLGFEDNHEQRDDEQRDDEQFKYEQIKRARKKQEQKIAHRRRTDASEQRGTA